MSKFITFKSSENMVIMDTHLDGINFDVTTNLRSNIKTDDPVYTINCDKITHFINKRISDKKWILEIWLENDYYVQVEVTSDSEPSVIDLYINTLSNQLNVKFD